MSKNILKIENVKKFFNHKNGIVEIFKDISLDIKKGDLVALVGPSGSGKSTLLNIVSLLDKPDSGEIFFNNINLKKLDDDEQEIFLVNYMNVYRHEKITNENIDSDEEYDNENKESMIKEINDGYIITKKINIKIN